MKKRTLAAVVLTVAALSGCARHKESALEKQTVEGMRAAGLSHSYIKAHLAQAEKQQQAFDDTIKDFKPLKNVPVAIAPGGVGFGSFPPPKQ